MLALAIVYAKSGRGEQYSQKNTRQAAVNYRTKCTRSLPVLSNAPCVLLVVNRGFFPIISIIYRNLKNLQPVL
jgi:hypothetical protein